MNLERGVKTPRMNTRAWLRPGDMPVITILFCQVYVAENVTIRFSRSSIDMLMFLYSGNDPTRWSCSPPCRTVRDDVRSRHNATPPRPDPVRFGCFGVAIATPAPLIVRTGTRERKCRMDSVSSSLLKSAPLPFNIVMCGRLPAGPPVSSVVWLGSAQHPARVLNQSLTLINC